MLESNWDERFALLEQRVTVLELSLSSKPGRKRDELGIKILAFLKELPGLRFNSGTIAANIGAESKTVSTKLKAMTGRGIIRGSKEEGQSAMFWYEIEKESE